MDLDLQRKGKSAVIKTSTRQVLYMNTLTLFMYVHSFLFLDIFPSCNRTCGLN